MCKNKGKHCTNVVDIITLVQLSLRTSDVATADEMTLVTVLHQLLTFADAMSPVKGLHEFVTLTFISVTYFCFENKFVWKLTYSSPFNTYLSFYHSCESYLYWTTTSLVFLKLTGIVL